MNKLGKSVANLLVVALSVASYSTLLNKSIHYQMPNEFKKKIMRSSSIANNNIFLDIE